MKETTAAAVDSSADKKPTARRWWQRLKSLLLLVVVLALLPSLVTISGQAVRCISFFAPELASATQIQSARLHLWQPIELRGIRIQDPPSDGSQADSDEPLLQIGQLNSKQTLWQILSTRATNLHLSVRSVQLNVVVQDGRTNVEDALQKFGLDGASSSGESDSQFAVNAEDVTVRLREVGQPDTAPVVIGPGSLSFAMNPSNPFPIVDLQTELQSAASRLTQRTRPALKPILAEEPTRVAAHVDDLHRDAPLLPFADHEREAVSSPSKTAIRFQILPSDQNGSGQKCHVLLQGLDVARLQPLIHRYRPGFNATGQVGLQIDALLPGTEVAGVAGRFLLQATDIQCRDAAWADKETLELATLSAEGAMALADDGVMVERLKVDSNLITVAGSGEVRREMPSAVERIEREAADRPTTIQQVVDEATATTNGRVRIKVRLDVAELCRMLPRTLHLNPNVQFESGQVLASCRVATEAESQNNTDIAEASSGAPKLSWQVAFQPTEFRATTTSGPVQIDPALRLDLSGGFQGYQPTLSLGRLSGASGDLQLSAAKTDWELTGQLSLRRLWQQFRNLIDLPRPELEDIRIAAKAQLQSDRIDIKDVTLDADGLQLNADRLAYWYDRPALESLHGTVEAAGEVSALAAVVSPWAAVPAALQPHQFAFRMVAERGQRFDLQTRLIDSSRLRSSATDEFSLSAQIERVPESDGYDLRSGRIQIPGLTANVSGKLRSTLVGLFVDLQARCGYDLEVLQNQYLPELRDTVLLSGRDSSSFTFRGYPHLLTSRTGQRFKETITSKTGETIEPLSIHGTVGWDGGRLAGLSLGPGEATVSLIDGFLRTSRIDCSAGSGRLSGMLQWDVVSSDLQLASGTRLDNVNLTPELCDSWLTYVSPLLARSAAAEGLASLRVERLVWNTASSSGTGAASLQIEHGTLAPSPSVQPVLQALTMLTQEPLSDTAVRLPRQTVRVELSGQQIHHDNFAMTVNNYPLQTQGTVALNGPVDVLLQIGTKRSDRARASDFVSVPVRGTTSQPRIDLQGLLQNAGRQQVQDRLNQELDRGLNKLFDKLR